MARFHLNNLPEKERVKVLGEFYDIISSLKKREYIRAFFRDLLSPDEIVMLHRRIQIAFLIKENYTFDEIAEKLKVGRSTIAKVLQSINRHGEGYDLIIQRFQAIQRRKEIEAALKYKRKAALAAPSLRHYPGFSLIIDLIDEISASRELDKLKKQVRKH